MKRSLEAWLLRRWYGGVPPGPVLRLLSRLYARVAESRRRRALGSACRPPVPVVVVGNLGVGGAGKTPLVITLVQVLREAGWSPGVVSRGYGRRGSGPVAVDAGTSPEMGGDEPCLIARRTGAVVRVDGDRCRAAAAAFAAGCDLILADDGLQHYRLGRDIEIEVIDGQRRYGNGLLLPAGPLREPPARAARCDFHVLNGGAAGPGEVPMQLRLGMAHPLGGGQPMPLATLAGQRVHAVAGIAHPPRFFQALREHGIEVIGHAFADHHAYTAADFRFDEALPVLMTEKDAVKCAGLGLDDTWVVPVDAALPDTFLAALLARLTALDPRSA